MRIKKAAHIGFCFGVRRAVRMAHAALNNNKHNRRIFCLGSLIHNPQEVRRLSGKGLKIVNGLKNIKKGDCLIIRSHGLLPGIIESLKRRGVSLIDATCPFVKKAQDICQSASREGFSVILIGDRSHPEVKALAGFTGPKAFIVEDIKDLNRLRLKNKKLAIVAQTTQAIENFQDLINAFLKRYSKNGDFSQIRIFNTICRDSSTRQEEARKISSSCDVMLVVGGKNSANSRRLFNICKEKVKRVYHIETVCDIYPEWFKVIDRVGIVSGASTPDWMIGQVLGKVSSLKIKDQGGFN